MDSPNVSPHVFLFDIDGTLVRTGGAGRRALDQAFLEIHGVESAFAKISFVGATDAGLLQAVYAEHLSRPPLADECERLLARYLELLEGELKTCNYEVLPGVLESLERLENDGIHAVGLATGNIEAAAELKLTRGGLWQRFAFGGYGDDGPRRVDMTRCAAKRGERSIGRPDHAVVVVGDSIYDIQCAHAIGARSVAVCTGWTEPSLLAQQNPTLLLDDLSHPAEWLSRLLRN